MMRRASLTSRSKGNFVELMRKTMLDDIVIPQDCGLYGAPLCSNVDALIVYRNTGYERILIAFVLVHANQISVTGLMATINILFLAGSPTAVLRGVISVIINAVQGQALAISVS